MTADKQTPPKAFCGSCDNFDPDSNATKESDLHQAKQPSPKTSTDAGMRTSVKPLLLNASLSIRDNRDPDSNGTNESRAQLAKHSAPKNVTDRGMGTQARMFFANDFGSIRSNFEFKSSGDLPGSDIGSPEFDRGGEIKC
jgi:hypothetical protein